MLYSETIVICGDDLSSLRQRKIPLPDLRRIQMYVLGVDAADRSIGYWRCRCPSEKIFHSPRAATAWSSAV